jgi:hypothetical protein
MKRIFILCSWLGADGKTVPSFFKEQAELFSKDFDMSLLNFSEVFFYGFRNFLKDPVLFRKTVIETNGGLILIKFEYARFRLLPNLINKKLKKNFTTM